DGFYENATSTAVGTSVEYITSTMLTITSLYSSPTAFLKLRMLNSAGASGFAGAGESVAFMKVVGVNLTMMGALDPVRAAKYGVSNWSDLTEAQLEAEIPYFDSVMSVNVEDGTASELTVENRGKNLFDIYKLYEATEGLNITRTLTTKDGYDVFRVTSNYESEKVVFNKLKPNTRYRLIAKVYVEHPTSFNLFFSFRYTDGTVSNFYPNLSFNNWYLYTGWVSTAGKTIANVAIGYGSNSAVVNVAELMLIEYGTDSTYTLSRTDSITIPDTVELHGWGGNYDEWSGNQYTKRIAMTKKTTDLSANFTLSGYKLGTQVIVMKDSTGEVQVLDAAASVSTGWNETACTVWYVLSTPIVSEVKATGGLYLYEGQNNVLCPDSKLPALIMLTHTAEGTDELLAFVRNFSANARSESIRFKPHFSTKKRTILTRRGYEISFDDPIIDGDWDLRQFEDTRFTIMEELGSEKIKYHGCAITELESSDDDIVIHKVKLIAETKEVV
ncbi:MAG: hypothetical protein GXX80_13770, partial [Thermotogaceae bacterium]|nr:hypothetical protein [Thermotogaceae bacterium]